MLRENATGINITHAARKVVLAFSPFVFLFFTACGGGGDDKPPVPQPLAAGTDENLKHVEELLKKLTEGQQQDCEKESLRAILGIVSAEANRGGGRSGGGGIPDSARIGSGLAATPTNGNGGGAAECAKLVDQIIWNATRVKFQNGNPWINEVASKIWLAKKLGKFLNRIGGTAGRALGIAPETLLARYKDQILAFTDSNIISRLGSGLGGGLRNELLRYGLGGGDPSRPGGGTFGYDERPRFPSYRPFYTAKKKSRQITGLPELPANTRLTVREVQTENDPSNGGLPPDILLRLPNIRKP